MRLAVSREPIWGSIDIRSWRPVAGCERVMRSGTADV